MTVTGIAIGDAIETGIGTGIGTAVVPIDVMTITAMAITGIMAATAATTINMS